MKAAIYTKYGSPEVVSVVEIEKPEPKPGELLIRINAAALSSGDARMRAFDIPSLVMWLPARLMMGVFTPRNQTLGTSLAGVVEALGEGVTRFAIGDRVFGSAGMGFGTHGEFITLKEQAMLAMIPQNLSDEQAVSIPFGFTTAYYFLKKAKIEPGQRVLVIGASGAVGTAAIQLAKHQGAHVTGVCSTGNMELVRSIGADDVIDYTKDDFTSSAQGYDCVFDTVGVSSYLRCKKIINLGGCFLAPVMGGMELLGMLWTPLFSRRRVIGGIEPESNENLQVLKELAEAGVLKPVIDRCYPIEEVVEAHRYVDTGRKKGNVILTMVHD